MIIASPSSVAIAQATRFDASYFTAPGVAAANRLNELVAHGSETFRIDEVGNVEHVTRFKRVLAASNEDSMPFLRAFDVFEYLPEPADRISISRTPDLAALKVETGVILVTRSGRNLGPTVMTDEYLAGFIPSDDLLRIRIEDERQRLFTFAFLSSPTGQDLLRQDRTGSVISHLSAGQVGRQVVPVMKHISDTVVKLVREAHELRSNARLTLSECAAAVDAGTPKTARDPSSRGWSVRASELFSRFDAAFHQDRLRQARLEVLSSGGVRLGDVARVTKPGGRYKTNYVSADHGSPLLSGRQLLQYLPIGQKYLANSVFDDAEPYKLKAGMVAFQADGRAEESLGQPVLITEGRDGWLASGHVGRIKPHSLGDAGWIWASIASRFVRDQIAAIACGSVVDALYPVDLENLILPDRSLVDSDKVMQAWNDFDSANELMSQAIEKIEVAFWSGQRHLDSVSLKGAP